MATMQNVLPYSVDLRTNLAVRDFDGELICVADTKEHAEFIVCACNSYQMPIPTEFQMQA